MIFVSFVPHTGQVPCSAGLPRLHVVSDPVNSRFSRHFMQGAPSAIAASFPIPTALEPPRTGGSRTMVVAPTSRCKHPCERVAALGGGPGAPVRPPPYDAGSGGAERDGPVAEPASDVARNIEALLSEDRVFEPPPGFSEAAVVRDPAIYDRANRDHQAFWVEQAERLTWSKPWDSVMEWNPPWATWFAGGQLNASVNCLGRHVDAGGGDKVAFYWEGEPGDTRVLTYRDVLDEVSRLANALRSLR